MAQTCSSCNEPLAGRFCSHCGTSAVEDARCSECGNDALPPGARFCNQCGVPVVAVRPAATLRSEGSRVAPLPARTPSHLPWYVAGAAVVALAAVILVPRFRQEPAEALPAPFATAGGAPGAPPGDARSVDLSSMTPREQADRLYDRIMRSLSAGDTAQARAFLPMAFGAYDRLDALDADARYHLGTLYLLGNDPAAARAEADALLTADPTHLFGLFVAAQAEQERGNTTAAAELYQQLLDAYPAEVARNLPEYQAHQPALPGLRAEAEAFLAARG